MKSESNLFCSTGGRILIKPLIEFCVGNLASGSQAALEKLEKDPNLDVMEYGCLGYCGICFEGPFALVNGEVVQGATVENLLIMYMSIWMKIQCFKVLQSAAPFSFSIR